MKVSAITDDSKTISQHFGCATYYLVVTVEENLIVDVELYSSWNSNACIYY